MEFETFGENISELTRHVFDTVSITNFYKIVLKIYQKQKVMMRYVTFLIII